MSNETRSLSADGRLIYVQKVDRSIDMRFQEWWLGVYTNSNCRDGKLGNVPLDSTDGQIKAFAVRCMRDNAAIAAYSDKLDQEGKSGQAGANVVNRFMKKRGY